MPRDKDAREVIARNKKALHNYSIEETFEAGMVLVGSEIKSIRQHHVSLGEGYVEEKNGEMWLLNVHIDEYKEANRFGHEPLRPRKLLLHRKEIARLVSRVRERGYTVVPLQMYLKGGIAKVEIALARGKKQYDKRDAIADRESERNVKRALKEQSWE